jgi:hypothetical protein
VVAITLPSLAFWSFPRRLFLAICARWNFASWSRMPSVSSLLRGAVAAVVKGAYPRPVFLELALEEVMVGGLAGEAVPVLRQHHGDAAGGHEVAHAVHAGPLQACPALPGVRHLFEDFVAFLARVGPQSLHLLGEGVTLVGLLLGGHAGVEDGAAGTVAVRVGHGLSPLL